MPRPVRFLTDRVITYSVTGVADASQHMNSKSVCLYEQPDSWMPGYHELDQDETNGAVLPYYDLNIEDLSDGLMVEGDMWGFWDNITNDTTATTVNFSVAACGLDEDPESISGITGNYAVRDNTAAGGSALTVTNATPQLLVHGVSITPVALTAPSAPWTNGTFGIWHWNWKMCVAMRNVTSFDSSTAQWRQFWSSRVNYNTGVGAAVSAAAATTGTNAVGWSAKDFSNGIRLAPNIRKTAARKIRLVCSSAIIRTIPESTSPMHSFGGLL